MKVILILVVLGLTQALPRQTWSSDWEEWKANHGKVYVDEEEPKRQMIWSQNLQDVTKHNYEYDLGQHTYRMGMNQFADMTADEFKAMYLTQMQANVMDICQKNMSFVEKGNMPDMVDWRTKGYVTPVKNQMRCGSCWAFSTTGSLEGQHFKKTGELVSLSEQNLIDCSKADGNMGCSGGLMDNAFHYIRDNGGIDTESSYPYKAANGQCHFSMKNVGATLKGCVDIPHEDEMALKVAVAKIGPISVAIDAGHQSFQLYESGVYYEPMCSETKLDHGVLAVGYGTQDGKDYWLVKNSWGATWGHEKGYIMMSRNKNNNCGIATQASYPLV